METDKKSVKQTYLNKALLKGVPGHTAAGLSNYIVDGVETGGFLQAVLSNDLFEAFGRADGSNFDSMKEIVVFLYNDAPMACYGSADKMQAWINKGGLS